MLADILATIAHPRILLLGDVMLDRYTFGVAERVSPEAPVVALQVAERQQRLGGAASAAYLLRRLEARVSLAGVTGADPDQHALVELLDDAGIEHTLLMTDPLRPTTVKERIMGRADRRHAHQMLRVDHESRMPLAEQVERELVQAITSRLDQYAALLISDYGKGVCTPGLLAQVIAAAASKDVPVLVDPARNADFERYRGAGLVKPNRLEAELATGRQIATVEQAQQAGHALCQRYEFQSVLLTLDSQGMVLCQAEGPWQSMPTKPRAVYDVTGAGDMALAALGLCVASGVSLSAAARLANVAAGLEVERLGVAPVLRREILAELAAPRGTRRTGCPARKLVTLDRMCQLAERYRRAGRSIVLTNGCFDLLHAGHVRCLQEAARLGDRLVVAVNSDASVRRLKGPSRPVVKQADRTAILAALGCVDHVLVFDDETPDELLRRLRPEVLVKGGTYTPEQVIGREIVESYGGRICVTEQLPGLSTTGIVDSLRNMAPANA